MVRTIGRGLAAAVLVGGGTALTQVPAASALTTAAQAFGGSAAGVESHVALADGNVLAQVATARAATRSSGLVAELDELGRPLVVAEAGKATQAAGTAVVLELGGTPVLPADTASAKASAPPDTDLISKPLAQLPVGQAAYAQALLGQAQARFGDDGCVLGADLAFGKGEAADAQVLGSAAGADGRLTNPVLSAEDPTAERAVVTSIARQRLVAQTTPDGKVAGSKIGVRSEVRQTVAPTTVRSQDGTVALTIEVVGVYTLRAVAGGLPGTAYVQYNPDVAGQKPVLKLSIPAGSPIEGLNDVIGPIADGLGIQQPDGSVLIPLDAVTDPLAPLLEALAENGISIGEAPRARGGAFGSAPVVAANGTSASAAIDLVRIQPAGALEPLGALADVRIGHMEVSAFAPAGGITCPGLGVAKGVDKDPVAVGESFTTTITVTNPYDCTLTNVKLTDEVDATSGITFTVTGSEPAATSTTPSGSTGEATITFNDIGPIPPKGSKAVKVTFTVDAATRAGRIEDLAKATADCALGSAAGDAKVGLAGQAALDAPRVTRDEVARAATPPPEAVDTELPRTGGSARTGGLALLALLAAGGFGALRRRAAKA